MLVDLECLQQLTYISHGLTVELSQVPRCSPVKYSVKLFYHFPLLIFVFGRDNLIQLLHLKICFLSSMKEKPVSVHEVLDVHTCLSLRVGISIYFVTLVNEDLKHLLQAICVD